ncbi:MAG: hypothetical protein NTY68_01945 [Candidatus Micrarchaeota archaeon]|nr:hypothetical protein [Candidatus Micrarchaeota archaeon]
MRTIILAVFLGLVLLFGCCGLTNPSANKPLGDSAVFGTKGFSGVNVNGWSLDPTGTFSIKISNNIGTPIRLDSINVTIGGVSAGIPVTNVAIANGEDSATLSSAMGAFGAQSTGTSYSAKIHIEYTDINDARFPYVSDGTLAGKVS